jgi:hypothetical protein
LALKIRSEGEQANAVADHSRDNSDDRKRAEAHY